MIGCACVIDGEYCDADDAGWDVDTVAGKGDVDALMSFRGAVFCFGTVGVEGCRAADCDRLISSRWSLLGFCYDRLEIGSSIFADCNCASSYSLVRLRIRWMIFRTLNQFLAQPVRT